VEEAPQRAVRGIGAAQDLLHVQPDRHRVVAVARTRRPCRLLAREQPREIVEVTQLFDGQCLVEQDESGLVPEELAHGDLGFAVLRELGPVTRHRRIVIEPAARVRQGQRHRREALGAGHDDDHGVFVPGRVALGRAAATPQIHDPFTAPVRRNGGADLAPRDEVVRKLGAHRFEPWRDESINARPRRHGSDPAVLTP